MKDFVKKVLLFSALSISGIVILCVLSVHILRNVSFDLPADKTVLVLGDSHTQCAIDDRILSQAVNVSSSATSYLYSYIKLRRFLEENKHLKTVVLSYHHKSLDKSLEQRWLYSPEVMEKHIPLYFPFMEGEDIDRFTHKPSFYLSLLGIPRFCFDTEMRASCARKLTYAQLPMGGFGASRKMNLREDIEKREGTHVKPAVYSKLEHAYLKKIIGYCHDRSIRLILLSTPVYHSERYADVRSFELMHRREFFAIPYLNYSNLPLADSAFADVDHLNVDGARIFCNILASELATTQRYPAPGS